MMIARRLLPALVLLAVIAAMSATGAARAPHAEAADCNKIAFPNNIQQMIDASAPGDVICLTPGVFIGPVTVNAKHNLTLRGAGPAADDHRRRREGRDADLQ